jgi:serine/threonine-protein kinase RsbW
MTALTLACDPEHALTKTWPGLPENVGEARHWLYDRLAAEAADTRHRAATVLSELVTNALRHTRSGVRGGRFKVIVVPGQPWILISVVDEGAADVPIAADLGPDLMDAVDVADLPESGMGIALLIGSLAESWGHEPYGPGRCTWATIARRRT